jgi:hypothetical protein
MPSNSSVLFNYLWNDQDELTLFGRRLYARSVWFPYKFLLFYIMLFSLDFLLYILDVST